jgi:bifunctional non-homologous end joining protein LigD
MKDLFAGLSKDQRKLLRRSRQPRSVEPMKAVLTDERFSDPAWIFERKLDGIRCVAFRNGREVRLVSRTGKSQNSDFPGLVDAIGSQGCGDFVIDGEVVAFRRGVTSFARLQQRHRERVPLFLYVFDLLHLDGHDVTRLPLRSRKSLLRAALEFQGSLRFTPHRNRDGQAFFEEACVRGLEGLIAKRADSPYVQKRSADWLKMKCSAEQELVIGGFTAPRGSRTDFGALLVGYFEDGELRYAGKVGTGFDRDTLARLGRRLRQLERESSPFAEVRPLPAGTHWVEPELVAQVAFTEWTRDGRLRHPRFLGLRNDKPAREVVRERPA